MSRLRLELTRFESPSDLTSGNTRPATVHLSNQKTGYLEKETREEIFRKLPLRLLRHSLLSVVTFAAHLVVGHESLRHEKGSRSIGTI